MTSPNTSVSFQSDVPFRTDFKGADETAANRTKYPRPVWVKVLVAGGLLTTLATILCAVCVTWTRSRSDYLKMRGSKSKLSASYSSSNLSSSAHTASSVVRSTGTLSPFRRVVNKASERPLVASAIVATAIVVTALAVVLPLVLSKHVVGTSLAEQHDSHSHSTIETKSLDLKSIIGGCVGGAVGLLIIAAILVVIRAYRNGKLAQFGVGTVQSSVQNAAQLANAVPENGQNNSQNVDQSAVSSADRISWERFYEFGDKKWQAAPPYCDGLKACEAIVLNNLMLFNRASASVPYVGRDEPGIKIFDMKLRVLDAFDFLCCYWHELEDDFRSTIMFLELGTPSDLATGRFCEHKQYVIIRLRDIMPKVMNSSIFGWIYYRIEEMAVYTFNRLGCPDYPATEWRTRNPNPQALPAQNDVNASTTIQ